MGTANMLLGAAGPFLFFRTITSDQVDYNLYNQMIAAGWDGQKTVNVNLTINAGVTIYASANTIPAFTISSIPANSLISITNNGLIVGRGGEGVGKGWPGNGDYNLTAPASANGGTAFSTTAYVSIDNLNGTIGGGGGGGGAGGATSADCRCDSCGGVALAGMGVGAGGAGFGAQGNGYFFWTNRRLYHEQRTSTGGSATAAGSQNGTGGAGGSLGQPGDTGSGSPRCGYDLQSGPGTGGAGGACTSGNSPYITWVNNGIRLGALN
jgi:hypothetical protein